MKNYLICSAVESEVSILQNDFETFQVGIGLVESAIRLASFLVGKTFDSIIFTGTVGAYKSAHLGIGDVITCSSHKLIGSSSVLNHSYFPRAMQKEIFAKPPIETGLIDASCASVLEITKTSELADRIVEEHNVSVEHMELYSVASICSRLGIPLLPIMGIANTVYEHSHVEWLQNNEFASLNAQNKIISLLR